MLLQRTILLAAIAAVPIWATQLGATYSSASAMMTANSDQSFTNIDFSPFQGTSADSFTTGLAVFSGTNALSVEANPGGSWPAGSILRRANGNPGQPISITLDPSVRAFGASFGVVSVFPGVASLTVSYFSDQNYSYTLDIAGLGAPVYLGFVTNSAITNLTITPAFPQLFVALNNASYGVANLEVAETPEVGTLVLIGSGLLTVRFLHRRKMKAARKSALRPETKAAPAAVVNRAPVSASGLRLSAEPC
jgi:hypothetical protein